MQTIHNLHPIDTPVGARGTTVRRGPKWYSTEFGDPAEPAEYGMFELCECGNLPPSCVSGKQTDHRVVGHGRLFSRALINFSTLTDEMLKDEHEESSRTVEGLMASMRRAYGEEFDTEELVTVLNYWRVD